MNIFITFGITAGHYSTKLSLQLVAFFRNELLINYSRYCLSSLGHRAALLTALLSEPVLELFLGLSPKCHIPIGFHLFTLVTIFHRNRPRSSPLALRCYTASQICSNTMLPVLIRRAFAFTLLPNNLYKLFPCFEINSHCV